MKWLKTVWLHRQTLVVYLALTANVLVLLKIGILQVLETGIASTPVWDFKIYHQIAQDVLAGANPYHLAYMQTLGPPSVIIPFLPFALLPLVSAIKLFFLLNLLAAWYSLYLLTKRNMFGSPLVISLLLLLVLLTSFPARFTLIVGQPHFITMLVITWLLVSEDKYLKTATATMLVVIKAFFILPLVLLFLKKQVSLVAVSSFLVLGLVSLLVIKPAYYQEFLQQRLAPVFAAERNESTTDYYNQSLQASLDRINANYAYPWLFFLMVGIIVYLCLRQQNLELAIIGSILVSPVIWQHYLVLIFPVMLLVLSRIWRDWRLVGWWLLGFGLWWIEFPWIHSQTVNFFSGLLASHYFLSLVVFFCLSAISQNQQSSTAKTDHP